MKIMSANVNQEFYSPKRNNQNLVTNNMSTASENVYAPPRTSVSDKNSDKPVSELQNDAFYNELKNKAASSEEELAQQSEYVREMYLTASTARKFYNPSLMELPNAGPMQFFEVQVMGAREADNAGCILIPLGAGKLPEFMDHVMDSLKNGISFEQALQTYSDMQLQLLPGGLYAHSSEKSDFFFVNPSSGEVMSALMGGRPETGWLIEEVIPDSNAVYELADDLNTFLRYAAFPQKNDDPEKVSELFSYIKNKQAYANYDRFLADGGEKAANAITETLIAAGVLKGDNKEDEEKEEAVDALMETIRVHQEKLRENKIDKEESEKAVAEIREIMMINQKSKDSFALKNV